MKKEMDVCSDYLLSSSGQVTATGLSGLLDGAVSHDTTPSENSIEFVKKYFLNNVLNINGF
jgi:hypothetical protein